MMIALLLLPVMQRTAEQYHTFPHVVITTSVAHFLANTTTDLVNDPAPVARIASKEHSTNRSDIMDHLYSEKLTPYRRELRERYPLTKMFNMLLVRGLTSRLPPSSPIVVCGVNPGYCHSGLQRHNFFPNTIILWIMEKTLIRGTADGAKTLVHAGISGLPEIERTEREAMRGAYMEDCRPQEPADFLFTQQGETFEGKVWVSTITRNNRWQALMSSLQDESVEILAQKDPRVRQVVAQYLSRGV
jgi:retinol dehydrogenase-12